MHTLWIALACKKSSRGFVWEIWLITVYSCKFRDDTFHGGEHAKALCILALIIHKQQFIFPYFSSIRRNLMRVHVWTVAECFTVSNEILSIFSRCDLKVGCDKNVSLLRRFEWSFLLCERSQVMSQGLFDVAKRLNQNGNFLLWCS